MNALQAAESRCEAARQAFYEVAGKRVGHDTGIEQVAHKWTEAIEEVKKLKKLNKKN